MRLMLGDCIEEMSRITDESVDLVLTDLPYLNSKNKWDQEVPFDKMWEQVWRISKPNAACLLFGTEPFSSALRLSQVKYFKYDWIWHKTGARNSLNAKKQPLRASENISVFYRKQPTYNPQGLKEKEVDNSRPNHVTINPDDMLYNKMTGTKHISKYTNYPVNIIKESNPNHKSLHPTQKPVKLLEYFIKTYTDPGQLVLDFTMGSGSTGEAAKNSNRGFVGIEKEKKYFEIAQERLLGQNDDPRNTLA